MAQPKKTRFLYQLKNAELKGKLETFLIEKRDEGFTYEAIAETLSKKGQPVAKTTVYEWFQEILLTQ